MTLRNVIYIPEIKKPERQDELLLFRSLFFALLSLLSYLCMIHDIPKLMDSAWKFQRL